MAMAQSEASWTERPLAPRWRFAYALEGIHSLNEKCLAAVAEAVSSDAGLPWLSAAIADHPELWWRLHRDVAAQRRAANVPVALLDLRFQQRRWWEGASRRQQSVDSKPRGNAIAHADILMREMLTLAWSVAREDYRASRLLFGMSDAVATSCAALLPHDIEEMAAQYADELRIRWENAPIYWSALLVAALENDSDKLRDIHLYGLQLLGGEFCGDATLAGHDH
jgi:hypothetical protein